jgi:predicted CXXCH cytochrome family protein
VPVSSTHNPRIKSIRRLVLLPIAACWAVALLGWAGCSIEKHYETLSFFFDGVPDPNAPGRTIPGAGNVRVAIVSRHTAFEERRCEACHAESGDFGFVVSGFRELGSESCLSCHADVNRQHPVMHGPVAQTECLWCHDPHESVHPHLMRDPAPPLCLGCHSLELDERPRITEHADLDRNCLDCHFAHGGVDLRLLKPDWPVAGPGASEEADAPAEDAADTTDTVPSVDEISDIEESGAG